MKNLKDYKQTKDIPIYTATWKLLDALDDIHQNMQRGSKFTWGLYAVNSCLEMLSLLSQAFNKVNIRKESLIQYIDLLNNIENAIKLCAEKHYIDKKLYIKIIPILSNVQRQSYGWLNKVKDTTGQNSDLLSEETIS